MSCRSKSATQPEGQGSIAEGELLVVHESLGLSFEAEAGRPILDRGLELGLDMDYGCRVGACGACAIEVLEGLENMAEPDPIERDALRRYGLPPEVRLACRACVKGPVRICSLDE